MADQETRERWRRVEEIVEEFARARGFDGRSRWEARVQTLSRRHLKLWRASREELLARGPSGDELLRWREGDIHKDVNVSSGSRGCLEVSAEAYEAAGQAGIPAEGGAWCHWLLGEVEQDAPDLRERLVARLDEGIERLQPLSLDDLRREHKAMQEHVEANIDPVLEQFAAARDGYVAKEGYRDIHAEEYRNPYAGGRWTQRSVEWPRERPFSRITVRVNPRSQTIAVDGWAKCQRLWFVRMWTDWGSPNYWGESVDSWTDLGRLRELLEMVGRLLDLVEAADEFADEHRLGFHLGHSDHRLAQVVDLTRRGFLRKWHLWVELKGEVLTVEAMAEERKGISSKTLGTVEVADPDLCEKTMALVEQAWAIIGPTGSKDLGGIEAQRGEPTLREQGAGGAQGSRKAGRRGPCLHARLGARSRWFSA